MYPTPSTATPRRARAALAWAVLAFALLQGGLRYAIERWAPGVRDPEYGARLAHLRQGGSGPGGPLRVVMLGSSRTMLGLKAAEMGDSLTRQLGRPVLVHNYGEPGHNSVYHLFRWRRLRRDGVRPDLLLVEVMPMQHNASRPHLDSPFVPLPPAECLGAADLPLVEYWTGSFRPGLRRQWLLAWSFPWYTHRQELLRHSAPFLLPWEPRVGPAALFHPSGEPRMSEQDKLSMRTARALDFARGSFDYWTTDFRLGGPCCAALHQILEDCRADGIPVALVLMPEGPLHRSWYPEAMLRQVRDWLDGLRQEYGLTVVNAQEWLDEEDFFDSHHMLGSGSEKFTRRLEREAILPLLAGRYGARAASQVAELNRH
jgi:hypothetical protein